MRNACGRTLPWIKSQRVRRFLLLVVVVAVAFAVGPTRMSYRQHEQGCRSPFLLWRWWMLTCRLPFAIVVIVDALILNNCCWVVVKQKVNEKVLDRRLCEAGKKLAHARCRHCMQSSSKICWRCVWIQYYILVRRGLSTSCMAAPQTSPPRQLSAC